MSARSILLLLSCLLLAAASLAWWHLPRLWPRGVVAHSPLLGPAIRAEAYRWAGSAISHRDWAAYVSLDQRLDADPAAGARALVAALGDGDALVRRLAASQLLQRRLDPVAQAGLVTRVAAAARDRDPEVRAALISLLAVCGGHDGIVHAALADASAGVRCAAVSGLALRRDPRLLPAFLARLRDPADRVACAAMEALGELGVPDGVEPLLLALASGRFGAVRAAGDALRRLPLDAGQRHRRLVLIVAALRDDGVARSAMDAEGLLGSERSEEAELLLHEALADPDYQCRQFAAEQLRERGVEPSEDLAATCVEGLQDDDYPWPRSGRGLTWLCNAKGGTRWLWLHPEVGTAALRLALRSPDAQQRFLSAWLLAMRADAISAEAVCAELIPRLREEAGRPAALWAVQALYRFGDPARPHVEAVLATASGRQRDCLQLLLRDWDDPPSDRFAAARRGRIDVSSRYHDPAWEPALAAPGILPEPFPDIAGRW